MVGRGATTKKLLGVNPASLDRGFGAELGGAALVKGRFGIWTEVVGLATRVERVEELCWRGQGWKTKPVGASKSVGQKMSVAQMRHGCMGFGREAEPEHNGD